MVKTILFKGQRGFTLMGVMAVIAILAGLMAAGVTVVSAAPPTPKAAPAPPPSITTPPTLAGATPGVSYNQTLQATGGTTPHLWSVVRGSLPPGLSLSASGAITGIPTASGSYDFIARVTNSSGPSRGAFRVRRFSITVGSSPKPAPNAAPPPKAVPAPPPSITTLPTLADATPGLSYNGTLQATGGTLPHQWATFKGNLPSGLSLSASGDITGVPTTAGKSTFTAQVTDSSSPARSASRAFSITVGSSPKPAPKAAPPPKAAPGARPSITTTTLAGATPRVSYNETLAATGGTTPHQWAISKGTLPSGLSLSPSGAITGIPTTAGKSTFTAQVTDSSSPARSGGREFSIAVASKPGPAPKPGSTPKPASAASLPISTTAVLAGATPGVSYNQTLAAAGGTTPHRWSVVGGSLPPKLSLSPSGAITGIPTTAGKFPFTAQVTDSSSPARSGVSEFVITVASKPGPAPKSAPPPKAAPPAPLPISTTTLAGATPGVSYNETLQADGGTTPHRWSVVGGSLPPGLSLSASGAITGIPTAAGTYDFIARVTDSSSPARKGFEEFNITVRR